MVHLPQQALEYYAIVDDIPSVSRRCSIVNAQDLNSTFAQLTKYMQEYANIDPSTVSELVEDDFAIVSNVTDIVNEVQAILPNINITGLVEHYFAAAVDY